MIASAATPEFLFIYLSQGQFCCVDFDAPAEVFSCKWYAKTRRGGTGFYAVRQAASGVNRQTTVTMHKVIAGALGRWNLVDHKSRHSLDNRLCNLRPCSTKQNLMNSGSRGGSSKFKCVHWNKQRSKWQVRLVVDGKKRHVGYFADETEAARAYDAAALKYFGEFACLNFPTDGTSSRRPTAT